MSRIALVFFALLFLTNPAAQQVFAGQNAVAARSEKTVITVAKNGSLSVDQEPIRLRDLVATLNKLGIGKDSQIVVQGAEGADFKDISRVLETLAQNGLLPKGAID